MTSTWQLIQKFVLRKFWILNLWKSLVERTLCIGPIDASTSPPGIPLAFDTLVIPVGREFDNQRGGEEFWSPCTGDGVFEPNPRFDCVLVVLEVWVLVHTARFHFSRFYATNSKAVYLVARKLYNFKAIWILWKEKFEDNEKWSFYLSIQKERTICPRHVYFSTLGSSLKRREEILNLADNSYHIKSCQLFDISANPGAKFFMDYSVTLKKKQLKIVRVFFLANIHHCKKIWIFYRVLHCF